MLPFKPSILISQSADGSLLTLTDNSNYGDNSDGVVVGDITSMDVKGYNELGALLWDVLLAAGVGTKAITKDQVIGTQLLWTKTDDTTVAGTVDFMSEQFYNNSQRNVSAYLACGCGCKDMLTALISQAREYINGAQDAFILGDLVNAAAGIVDATIKINQALRGC